MLWVGIAVTLVAGIVALAAVLVKRPADIRDLGSVSDHWIARHRVDAP
jgi:hypothetical protein